MGYAVTALYGMVPKGYSTHCMADDERRLLLCTIHCEKKLDIRLQNLSAPK